MVSGQGESQVLRLCAQLHIRDGLECSILWRNGIVSFSSDQIMRIWLPYLWGTLFERQRMEGLLATDATEKSVTRRKSHRER
jgi:hypothetical protein